MRGIDIHFNGETVVGCISLPTRHGTIPIVSEVPIRPIQRLYARRYLRQHLRSAGVDGDEVGFGFLKKTFKKVWKKAYRVAKKVGVVKAIRKAKRIAKKALKTTKQVVQHPAFAAAVGVAAVAIPGAGPIIGASYAAVRAAMMLADGIKRGDPKALVAAGKYAMSNTPAGAHAAALLKSVNPQNLGVPPAANPWLKGLGNLITGQAPALPTGPAQIPNFGGGAFNVPNFRF